MKLLSIRILNINSLKGEFFIDFNTEPLSTSGLYAITGPTGSGKSTILDCITLAIYGKTPRQSSVTKSTILNYGAIINKNASEAVAEVEYKINDKYYFSKWSIKKNRNGNFNNHEMLLGEKKDSEYIPIVTKRSEVPKTNESIIGLDYEQFLKSILLSQGEFASFLDADPGDRSKILEKITGSSIYRKISIKAHEKQKQAKADLELKKQGLELVNLLSDEEINTIKLDINNAEKEKNIIDKELSEINIKISTKKRISEIHEQLKIISTDINKLNNDRENFKETKNKLLIHKKILPLKSDIDLYFNTLKSITEYNNKLKELSEKKEDTNHTLNENRIILKKLEQEKLVLNKENSNLKPILKQVKDIDININTEQVRNNIIKSQIKKHEIKKSKVESEIFKIEKEKNSNNKLISSKEIWLEENKVLENIFTDILNIKNQNEVFSKAINDLDAIINSKPKIEGEKVINPDFINKNIEEKHLRATTLLAEIITRKEKLEKEIKSKENIENLNVLIKKYDNEIIILRQLQNISDNYITNNDEANKFKQAKDNITNKQKELNLKKQKNDNELEILLAKIKELKAKKERQILERKYEEDRLKLKENEECPLCGSTHHPLVKTYINTISKTEKELAEKEEQHQEIEKNIKHINNEIIKSNEKINQFNKNLLELKNKNNELVLNFNSINTKKDFLIDKNEDIKSKLNDIETEKIEIAKQLDTKQKLQKAEFFTEIWTNILEKLEKIISAKQDLEDLFITYEKYLKPDLNISSKIEYLENLSDKYASYNKEILELKKQSEIQETNKSFLQKQLEEIINSLNKDLETDIIETEKINKLKEKRYEIFADKSVEEAELEIESKINANQKNISKIEKEIIEKATNVENLQNQIITIKETLKNAEQENNKLNTLLLKEIKEIGFSNLQYAKNSILASAQADEIEQKDKEFENILTKTETTLRNLQIEEKKLVEKTEEEINLQELEKLKSETEAIQEKYSELIGKNLNKLETNEQNKKQHKTLADEYNLSHKEYNKWASLSELIGSADGDKFSKFAQDLTLLHLLKLANENMKNLSDRYIIIHEKHNNIDDLFVIDTYMANEKRSVRTLSGGETFLVSLALALGLSKLAGKNTKIESLFIDEGFGSLDEKTLDLALSTLENLQYKSNITIGIISHVKALKERINTQIILNKNNLGISTIEVVG